MTDPSAAPLCSACASTYAKLRESEAARSALREALKGIASWLQDPKMWERLIPEMKPLYVPSLPSILRVLEDETRSQVKEEQ